MLIKAYRLFCFLDIFSSEFLHLSEASLWSAFDSWHFLFVAMDFLEMV